MRFIFLILLLTSVLITVSSCDRTYVIAQKEIPEAWKKVETDYFSFSIPPTLKKKDVSGIDSTLLRYEVESLTLDVEYGTYVLGLDTISKRYENEERSVVIDNEKGTLYFYDLNKPVNTDYGNADGSTKFEKVEKNYQTGVLFPLPSEVIKPGDRPAVSFLVSGKSLETREIAEQIISSIKFINFLRALPADVRKVSDFPKCLSPEPARLSLAFWKEIRRNGRAIPHIGRHSRFC